MSEECCGPGESRKTGTVRRVDLHRPAATDACCAPREPGGPATKVPADEGDACCGSDPARTVLQRNGEDEEVRPAWWRDRALLPSVLSGVFLFVGYIFEWSGLDIPAVVLQSAALVAGAYTFVPGAVRRLLRGRLGVGLLMTIAAIGAVLLGHVGEAATLAFLFCSPKPLRTARWTARRRCCAPCFP